MRRQNFGLSFGALAPPLIEQVPELAALDALKFQQDADAITRLAVRGLLTEAEVHRARQRLVTRIAKEVAK